ncbi:MAG: biopolymer transporter ExbD [Verrucomicrobiales bacterium]
MEIPSPFAKRRARIEIIPLIDIIFFLLATFVMVSLSMVKQRGISVELPAAQTASSESFSDEDVTITLAADGLVYWNKTEMRSGDIPQRLRELHRNSPDARLAINGDADARLGLALEVLDAARAADLRRIQFQTKPVAQPK